MSRRCCFAFVLVLVFLLFASAAGAEIDPRAAPVVRVLEARYHDAKTLKAVFLERYSDGREGLQAESGTVYFSRPGRMRWEYESPETKLFVSDGKTIWFYVPTDHSVTRVPVKQSTDWRTPLALLTGKVQLARLCDKIDLTDQVSGTLGNVVLRCLPRGEERSAKANRERDATSEALAASDSDFDQVLLEVNPKTGELSDLKVLQPGGIEMEYRFGNWQQNLPLEASLFEFRAPAGVAIVDGEASSVP